MKLVSYFFSFRGRANRVQYLLLLVSGYVLPFAGLVLVAMLLPVESLAFQLSALTYMIVMLWAFFAAMAKRLHDLDMSGGSGLLVLVPFVGGLLPIVLLFYPGHASENAYGPARMQPPPLPQLALST